MTTYAQSYLGEIELTITGQRCPAEPDVGISQPYYEDLWVEAAVIVETKKVYAGYFNERSNWNVSEVRHDLFAGLDADAQETLRGTLLRALGTDTAQDALALEDEQ